MPLPAGRAACKSGTASSSSWKLVFNAQRNVTVHVALAAEHAKIEVRAGEVLAAECGGLQGYNALVKLGRQGSGIFWLVETEQHCDRNIAEPFVRLLSELQRCLGRPRRRL